MSKTESAFKGTISPKYAKKQILKTIIGYLIFYASWVIGSVWLLYFFEASFQLDWALWIIIFAVVIPFIVVLLSTFWYFYRFVNMFSYEILESDIIINHGVFNRIRATIPHSRIQNINITNGVFDRMFKIYTVKVETAGSSAAAAGAKGGVVRPEGYIPGLIDPNIIEEKIKDRLTKYSTIPSGLEDKIFKPEEIAFDNFISYILSKMREGEYLKTTIKEKRENANMTPAALAEKVGVPIQTIKYLEEGRYNPSLALAFKTAEVLKCKVEDLFKLA
jgi:membrane protein YdbS with pleckstrin-like domain/DNA-binding XRE family transcriptional regulator